MKIIVGLGNPGDRYKTTRHNAGWIILDWLIMDLGFKIEDFRLEKKYDSEILKTENILFIKPQTYMNESGTAIGKIIKFTNSNITDLFIIHDEIDLPLGDVRLYGGEGTAGHQGIESIKETLGFGFTRLRIGIENRAEYRIPPTEDYVLQNFSDEELKKLKEEVFPKVKLEIEKFLAN